MSEFPELLNEEIERCLKNNFSFDVTVEKEYMKFVHIPGYKIKYQNASHIINNLRKQNLQLEWYLELNIVEIIQDKTFLSLIANGDEISFYTEFSYELYESIMNFVVKVQFREIVFSIKNIFRPIDNLFQMLRNIKQASRSEVFAWFSSDTEDLPFEEDSDDI